MAPDEILRELRSVVADFEGTSACPLVSESLAQQVIDLLLAFKYNELTLAIRDALRSEKIWPCQSWKDGPLTFIRLTDHLAFFVPDHPYLLEVFDQNIPILKLSLANIAFLEPLLTELDLGPKFLSRCVERIEPSELPLCSNNNITHDLRARADALTRYVSACHSVELKLKRHSCILPFNLSHGALPKTRIIHLLTTIQAFSLAEASTTYTIDCQNFKRTKTVPRSIHLTAEDDRLKVMIPCNINTSTIASRQSIAQEFVRFFGISSPEALQIVTTILTVDCDKLEPVSIQDENLKTDDTGMNGAPNKDIDVLMEKFRNWHLSVDKPREARGSPQIRMRASSALRPSLIAPPNLITSGHRRSKSTVRLPKNEWTAAAAPAANYPVEIPTLIVTDTNLGSDSTPHNQDTTLVLQPTVAPIISQAFDCISDTPSSPKQDFAPLEGSMEMDGQVHQANSFLRLFLNWKEGPQSPERTLRNSLRVAALVCSVCVFYLRIRV